MPGTLRLLTAIDDMYRSVATEPEMWRDQTFEDWAADLAGDGLTKDEGRSVRRCLAMGRKIRDFWSDRAGTVDADDWRSRVDVAFGARAWRPTLELAMGGLAAEPTEELFDEVRTRFRVVNGEPWMEGVDFAEWVDRRTDA